MNPTHETLLTDVLRDVYVYGSARVLWHHWYRWLDIDRMTKNKWRDIQRRWEALLDDFGDKNGWRLGFVDNDRGDFLTLICMDPEGAKSSWLKPVSAKWDE